MLKYVLLAFLVAVALFALISLIYVFADLSSEKKKEDEVEPYEYPAAVPTGYKKAQYCYMDCESCKTAENCPYSKTVKKAEDPLSSI